MVQRILASHEDVATASEPWVLLPYLYTLKERGVYAEYSHKTMVVAVEDFYREMPGGKDDYLSAMRDSVLCLYNKVAKEEVKYFLDKTPRYHLVVDDVIRLFPEGRFIFLWRNPLAVVSSIMETWSKGRWNLYEFKVDLFDGLSNLAESYKKHRRRVCAVSFEDLIINPEKECQRIFAYLGIPFDKKILSIFNEVKLKGRMGDTDGTRRYQSLSSAPLEKWKKTLANPVRKVWCRHYLDWIGPERLGLMGYEYEGLRAELNALPVGLSRCGSDVLRMLFGMLCNAFEPWPIKDKLGLLPAWHRIHWHS
jgi:hypothetical protein